jgi:acetyltransferase-like isoleucine patch superfamily enzyme
MLVAMTDTIKEPTSAPDTNASAAAPRKPQSIDELMALPYECGDTPERQLRCYSHPSAGPQNALWYYFKDVPFWRAVKLRILLLLSKFMPKFAWKNAVLRMTGMKVGNYVSVAHGVRFDPLFPEMIELGDNVIFGTGVLLAAHHYAQDYFEVGRIKIGARATISADVILAPGIVIGEGATIFANSVVMTDVPPGEVWGGSPARPLKT